MRRLINFNIVFLLIIECSCDNHSMCNVKTTCSDCITTRQCAWCSKSDVENEHVTRCTNNKEITNTWCPEEFIVNPKSTIEIKKNKDLIVGNDETIQIKPQHVKMELRLGETKEFSIYYQQAKDYPTDLYYLMDLSASMADDRVKLSRLGNELIKTMENITNNLRLGFGSFVEKPIYPFVNSLEKNFISTKTMKCIIQYVETSCETAYSFKNHLPLTADTNLFSSHVENTPISGNVDMPEGGFDALMQALVCTEEIGWRDNARRIIIYSTDAEFHIAGDGKLAGIIAPNDQQCHLNRNGVYTNSLNTDFPSISQLDKQARENNINIIFAVTKEHEELYKKASENIYGSTSGNLTKDSSNIVDLVKEQYDKLVQSILLTDNADEFLSIKYYSKCLGETLAQTNECKDLKGRPMIEFKVALRVDDCPQNETRWKRQIQIRPGNLNENVTIDLDIHCQCPCESKAIDKDSHYCSSSGGMQCGICKCDRGRYGRFCECDGKYESNRDESEECRPNDREEVCSKRGFCKCGKCDCFQRPVPEEVIYGKHCECDNYSCQRHNGLICSGPDRGRCDCGDCLCHSGWTGPSCECRESNATCVAPATDTICSGNGICECGICRCGSTQYRGTFCEECPHCQTNKCDQLRQCVQCRIGGSEECDESCAVYNATNVVEEKLFYSETDTFQTCEILNEQGCTLTYKYKYENDYVLKVYALNKVECGEHIDTSGLIIRIVSSIVSVGLVTIAIWKIITTFKDRKEYMKFEKERNITSFDRGENPIYRPSTSTFNNPTFGM